MAKADNTLTATRARSSSSATAGKRSLARARGAGAGGVGEGAAKTVVGFGVTITIGKQVVPIMTDDISKITEGKFKFHLAEPLELGSVKDFYNNFRTSDFGSKLGLPELDWEGNVFLKKIGSITTTIDEFDVDTEAGTMTLAVTFTFNFVILPGITLNTASVVINRKPAPAQLAA